VRLEARDLSLQQQSTVTTEASQTSGGAVTIAAHRLELQDSQVTAAVQGEADTLGGDIDIGVTGSAILRHSTVRASANEGEGGNIGIAATVAVILQHSTISASADVRRVDVVAQGADAVVSSAAFRAAVRSAARRAGEAAVRQMLGRAEPSLEPM
jgi:hypothetical protein